MANRYSNTRVNSTTVRFYDNAQTQFNVTQIEDSMTAEQKIYLGLNKAFSSNTKEIEVSNPDHSVVFKDLQIATPPKGFPAIEKTDFQIFINGMIVETDAVDTVTQIGNNVQVLFNVGLNFEVDSTDEFMITGKFV